MKRFILMVLVVLMAIPFGVSLPKAQAGDDPGNVVWYGEYYSNPYLIGTPTLVRQERGINFNFGRNAPASNLPVDNFSVRWGASPTFDAAKYRFSVNADDEVRVTLDYSNVILNTIGNPKVGQTLTYDVTLTAGQHHIQIDYREWLLDAYISFNWQKLDSTGNPTPQAPTLPSDRAAAYVRSSELNLRMGPSTGYTVIAKLSQYTLIDLLGRNSDASWVRVRTANGTLGWVSSYYITANVALSSLPYTDLAGNQVPTTPPAPTTGATTGTVIAGRLNVRYGPGTNYAVFTVVVEGQVLTLLARNDASTWVKVQLSNNALGWCSAAYLRLNGNIASLPIATN